MGAAVPQYAKPGRYRWVICGLLLAAMAINYIQRQTIGLLKSPLQHEFALDEVGYANIVFWFQAAYAVGYVSFGRVLDRIGARTGYAVAFLLWNLSHMAAGLAAPAIVPVLTATWGWRSSFFVTGAIGMLWLVAWLAIYRRPQDHPRVSPQEL